MKRFTLSERHWYEVDLQGDEFINFDEAKYAPIRVEYIRPQNTGKKVFELKFSHANPSQGVQGKKYILETIERREKFLLGRSQANETTTYMSYRLELAS